MIKPFILFFDDRKKRYQEFTTFVPSQWVYWARTPEQAINVLSKYAEDLKIWFLDHDMDQAPDTQLDGRDLVLWALTNSSIFNSDPKIIIHSLNPDAARAMYDMFKSYYPLLDVEQAMYAWLAVRAENDQILLGERVFQL